MRGRELDSAPVTRGQELGFAAGATTPNRADGVNDEPCRQTIALRDSGVAGLTTSETAALRQQLRTGGPMDRSIDAATAEERSVGGIYDGIDLERSDVSA